MNKCRSYRKRNKQYLMIHKLKDKAFKLRKQIINNVNSKFNINKLRKGLKLFKLFNIRNAHFQNYQLKLRPHSK